MHDLHARARAELVGRFKRLDADARLARQLAERVPLERVLGVRAGGEPDGAQVVRAGVCEAGVGARLGAPRGEGRRGGVDQSSVRESAREQGQRGEGGKATHLPHARREVGAVRVRPAVPVQEQAAVVERLLVRGLVGIVQGLVVLCARAAVRAEGNAVPVFMRAGGSTRGLASGRGKQEKGEGEGGETNQTPDVSSPRSSSAQLNAASYGVLAYLGVTARKPWRALWRAAVEGESGCEEESGEGCGPAGKVSARCLGDDGGARETASARDGLLGEGCGR